ncbi:hypothetical protein V1506DRAFT_526229 [Lipomyces tetrasporus]
MSLFVTLFVTLIFACRIRSAGLAYDRMHRVVAIALPATDANIFTSSLILFLRDRRLESKWRVLLVLVKIVTL